MKKVQKNYIDLVDGELSEPSIWRDYLIRDHRRRRTNGAGRNGKLGITRIRPILSEKHLTLISCQIETGRTHQIRSQAAQHDHPLTGDRKYGGSELIPFYILHAAAVQIMEASPLLGFTRISAPLPMPIRIVIRTLLGQDALNRIAPLLQGDTHT